MVNLKIGFAKKRGTPSEVYSPDNGYEYRFENGMPFTDVIVEGSLSLNVGFSYGSTPRTNTFKFNVACSMAQAKVLEGYSYIVVYKGNKLVYCGCQPTFNKTIRNGVGKQGDKESWVELQVSYDDYFTTLKDIKFSKEEDFELFYQASDRVKICDLENTEKSLIHILLKYLDPDSIFTVKFGKMPEILSTTVVQYFAVAYDDKVLSILQDVLEQAGLAMYIVCQNIYILDVLEPLTGEAVNIPNIESGATRQGKSYIDLRIPEIRMATARIATGMTIYDSGDMKMEGRNMEDVYRYYPDENSKMEVSFSCAREDDVPNGKKADEREKRYFNISEPKFYGQKVLGWGPSLYSYTKTSKGIKYGVRSECLLRCSWRLSVKGDVLLFKYDSAYKPDDTSLLNDGRKDCDYIFSADMAQRYANALRQQKVQSGTTYSFYADTDADHPNGYDINSVVTIQGTDEANPLMLIISKTDNFDPFGGYNYKAVPYDREGVKISNSYIESKEALPRYSTEFTASLSRDVVECFRNRTPRDTSPITFTAKIKNPLITPQLKVAETPVDMTRKTEKVRGTDSQEGDAETDEWVYNIDPNLNGYDTCKLTLTVEDTTVNYLISKLIKDDPVPPEVIVPSDWKKVTQYAYGNEQGVIETDISKFKSLGLQFEKDGWVAEKDGNCPLRPFKGYYIWQRQGVYDPKTAKSPTEWTVVMWGIPYYRFDFAVAPSTYTINKRATDAVVNEIYLQPFINGYDTSTLIISAILDDVTGKTTQPLSLDSESQRYLLTVPVKKAPSKSITISAKLGATSWKATLLPKDTTEYCKYFGLCSADPTGTFLKGDHYYNSTTKKIRYYADAKWVDLDDAKIEDQTEYAAILNNAMGDVLGSIEPGSVASSYYGYFQRLIAGIIRAENITVDVANIIGKISITDIDGGSITLTKDGIGATSADGKSSWQINADGTATFKNASITGNLEAKKVTHDALKTVDAVDGKSIGDSSLGPVVSEKTLWDLNTTIDGLRTAYLNKGHNYSGATINNVAIKHASITKNGASASVSNPAANTALAVGTTYSGSTTISAGDNKAVLQKLVNKYSFPIWVNASVYLPGTMNGINIRVYNASGSALTYPADTSVTTILMPNEGISVQGNSWAWWGSQTGRGTAVCNISSGYAETTTPQLLFHGAKTYGGGSATKSSGAKYVSIGKLTFTSPSRYLGVSYHGDLSGICRKDGSNYRVLGVKSSNQFYTIYDLGAELTSVELYYKSDVSRSLVEKPPGNWQEDSHYTYEDWEHEDENGETVSGRNVYELYYTAIIINRFAWTAFRTLGTEPLVIVDNNNKEYRYSCNGYSGLYRSDVIKSLYGYSSVGTMYSGKMAYDKIRSTLGVGIGAFNLNTVSKVTINGSTLSGLTYMTVEADRITFETPSGNLTFYTTGDTVTELKSAYSTISAYLVLLTSTLGVETADIRPKENNKYSIGAEGNVYSRGYFNQVWGAVFN